MTEFSINGYAALRSWQASFEVASRRGDDGAGAPRRHGLFLIRAASREEAEMRAERLLSGDERLTGLYLCTLYR